MSYAHKLIILFLFAMAALLWALTQGEVSIGLMESIQIIFVDDPSAAQQIIQEIRLPRVLAAFCVGAMLSLAGALMQILLRNPLADPYILGISGGAAVSVLIGLMLGLNTFWLDTLAMTGAFCATLLVFFLGFKRSFFHSERLLLTGVVLAAGWGALISLLLSISTDLNIRGMVFWLMGDLGHSPSTGYQWLLLFIIFIVIYKNRFSLNVMLRGEEAAASLGVPVQRIKLLLFVCASALTAMAVSLAGSIGFIGLIIPHLLRFFVGTNHTLLLPACVLFGGSFLLIADTFARTLITDQPIPVGAVTALFGVPLFLFLLIRKS